MDSLASLSKEMNLLIAAINVPVTDPVYTAASIAVKQWEGITLLAARLCLQSNSARGSQERYIVDERLGWQKLLKFSLAVFAL